MSSVGANRPSSTNIAFSTWPTAAIVLVVAPNRFVRIVPRISSTMPPPKNTARAAGTLPGTRRAENCGLARSAMTSTAPISRKPITCSTNALGSVIRSDGSSVTKVGLA